jgi:hypothetical protein
MYSPMRREVICFSLMLLRISELRFTLIIGGLLDTMADSKFSFVVFGSSAL